MTAVATRKELWNSMPGWGIAANLTPPELIASRRLNRYRRYVVAALVAVVALIVVGFGYAFWKHHTAADSLSSAQNQGASLSQQAGQYGNVVQIQGDISSIQGQLAGLMTNDSDTAALVNRIAHAAPPGVSITDLTITYTAPGSAATTPTGTLITSAIPRIGTITLDGTGVNMTDASAYVDALAKVPGLVDVYPVTNARQQIGTQFTITVSMTNKLLSNRFAAPTTTGGN